MGATSPTFSHSARYGQHNSAYGGSCVVLWLRELLTYFECLPVWESSRECSVDLNHASSYDAPQVAKHAQLGDCYVIVHHKVYDVTPYVQRHPGGSGLILDRAGGDVTAVCVVCAYWVFVLGLLVLPSHVKLSSSSHAHATAQSDASRGWIPNPASHACLQQDFEAGFHSKIARMLLDQMYIGDVAKAAGVRTYPVRSHYNWRLRSAHCPATTCIGELSLSLQLHAPQSYCLRPNPTVAGQSRQGKVTGSRGGGGSSLNPLAAAALTRNLPARSVPCLFALSPLCLHAPFCCLLRCFLASTPTSSLRLPPNDASELSLSHATLQAEAIAAAVSCD